MSISDRSISKIIRTSIVALTMASFTLSAQAGTWEPYTLDITRPEARDTLNQLLENMRVRGVADGANFDEETANHAARLIRSYRSGRAQSLMAIKDAPYPTLIINEKVGDVYPSAYDSAYNEQYDHIVNHVTLETLFDGFMHGIVEHTLPPSFAPTAKKIGDCLAKKVLQGGQDASCKLDNSDRISEPSFFAQLWTKVDCDLHTHTVSPCKTRKVIFNAAKRQLILARQSPEVHHIVESEFQNRFPLEFRQGFLDQIAGKLSAFPALIAAKFKGVVDEFWGPKTPLIETDTDSPTHMTMKGFAAGLRADLGVASLFARSQNPVSRGLSAPLFYGVANRLLVLTGGREAQWNGRALVVADGDQFDPHNPKKPPQFASDLFGGWGTELEQGAPMFSSWSWGDYDPTSSTAPTAFRLFPAEFLVGGRGSPRLVIGDDPSENLEDMADLLNASVDFLLATRPDGPFGGYFAGSTGIEAILDPASPVIFPREGRMLAIGTMAGVLKNLVAPKFGHLELKTPGSPDFGLGLAFHDRVTLAGRENASAPVRSVAKILMAAARLHDTLGGDPDVPADLIALTPKLYDALQMGSLVLGADGQEGDGGFRDRLGVAMTANRNLINTVTATRALTAAFEGSHFLLLSVRIKQAWVFLDRLWGNGVIPRAVEGVGGSLVSPSQLWELVNLWHETQSSVRPALGSGSGIDWDKWDSRFQKLEQKLKDQFDSPAGPAMLGDMPS